MNRSSFLRRCAAVSVSLGAWFLEGCGGGSGGGESPHFHYGVTEIANVPIKSRLSAGRLVARNRQGYCIGYGGDLYSDAFVVSPDGAVTILPELDMHRSTWVYGINNAGKVVGTSNLGLPEQFGFVYDIPTGVTTRIDALDRSSAINDADQVAGFDASRTIVTSLATGAVEMLPDLDGDAFFAPQVMTNSGLIVGTINRVLALYNLNTKTLRTVNPEKYSFSYPVFVSDSGKITGAEYELSYDSFVPSLMCAFIFDIGTGVKTYLPELPREEGNITSFPLNVAGNGVIGTLWGGYVYRQGRIQDINAALSADDQKTWKIWQPFAIDDSGIIYAAADLRSGTTASKPTYLLRLTPQ